MNTTLQSFHYRNLPCAPVVKNLSLKQIYLNHDAVSIITPVHRLEGVVLHYGSQLPSKGQTEEVGIIFLIDCMLALVFRFMALLDGLTLYPDLIT